MDPLTALSLAGNLVQFVDFGSRLLSEGRELYKSTSGALKANDELELVTLDLRTLVLKLRRSNFSTEDTVHTDGGLKSGSSFEKMCNEAATIAEDLIGKLEKLKVTGKHRLWKTIRQAIKSEWSKGEIDSLVKRLMSFKQALETHVLFSLRYAMGP
jgi:hypothetical protein